MSFSFLYSAKILYLSQPLPIPNWLGLIQYVCSLLSSSKGYTGFIPRYLWVYGENYVQAVKEAMDEFDRFQVNYTHKSYFKNITMVLIHLHHQKRFNLQ